MQLTSPPGCLIHDGDDPDEERADGRSEGVVPSLPRPQEQVGVPRGPHEPGDVTLPPVGDLPAAQHHRRVEAPHAAHQSRDGPDVGS